MKLFHPHYANHKLSYEKQILTCDAKGAVELEDPVAIAFFQETLGFHAVPEEKKHVAPKAHAPKVETKTEIEAPVAKEEAKDDTEEAVPKALLKKPTHGHSHKTTASRFKRSDA